MTSKFIHVFGQIQFLGIEIPISLLVLSWGYFYLLKATHISCHMAPSIFKLTMVYQILFGLQISNFFFGDPKEDALLLKVARD